MLTSKKFPTAFSILVIGIIILVAILGFAEKPDSQPANNEPSLPFGQITRQGIIDHVEWTYANGKQYEQYSLTKGGEAKYVIAFYQPNPRDHDIPREERRGGIIVFEITNNSPKLIWESTEYITLTRPTIDVRDITDDGNAEILANWSNGKVSTLYIYSWDNAGIKLITPIKKVEGLIGGSGNLYAPIFSSSWDIQVKDLDADSVDEVLLISPTVTSEFSTSIYKWDGSQYYFWKKLTDTSAPNP